MGRIKLFLQNLSVLKSVGCHKRRKQSSLGMTWQHIETAIQQSDFSIFPSRQKCCPKTAQPLGILLSHCWLLNPNQVSGKQDKTKLNHEYAKRAKAGKWKIFPYCGYPLHETVISIGSFVKTGEALKARVTNNSAIKITVQQYCHQQQR